MSRFFHVYDKYYSLEDLRAVNGFYSSPAGQKILKTLPEVMQESMQIGKIWGTKIGERVGREVSAEQNKKKQKQHSLALRERRVGCVAVCDFSS